MQFVIERDQTAWSTRSDELAYLANTLMAGCSIQARPFTTQEASDAALAVSDGTVVVSGQGRVYVLGPLSEHELRAARRSAASSGYSWPLKPFSRQHPLRAQLNDPRINHGKRLSTSGLTGSGKDGAAEVKDVFGKLDALLKRHGSDFKHLAKATYYVSTEAVSKALNELRPNYYDPQRPPAARGDVGEDCRQICRGRGKLLAVR